MYVVVEPKAELFLWTLGFMQSLYSIFSCLYYYERNIFAQNCEKIRD